MQYRVWGVADLIVLGGAHPCGEASAVRRRAGEADAIGTSPHSRRNAPALPRSLYSLLCCVKFQICATLSHPLFVLAVVVLCLPVPCLRRVAVPAVFLCFVRVWMDAPAPSRRRCREPSSCGARNVRARCPASDLAASRRRRREAAAEATLAARVGAGSARNVRSRLALLHVPLFPQATGVSAPAPVSIVPRNYIALRDHFCPLVPVSVARENRARRMARNRNRARIRKDCLLPASIIEPILAFPKEYATLLKETYSGRSYYGGPDL